MIICGNFSGVGLVLTFQLSAWLEGTHDTRIQPFGHDGFLARRQYILPEMKFGKFGKFIKLENS